MAVLTDLIECKRILEIDPLNTSEDAKLNFFIEYAGDLIEEYLDRKLALASRTEYYDGTGTPQLRLRCRPVFTTPTIQVWEDKTGYYGSESNDYGSETALTYGADFFLKVDQSDGISSRSGLLIRRNAFWPKKDARQRGLLSPYVTTGYGAVKVIYTAGYSVDTMPSQIRAASNLLVARLRALFPTGMEVSSESYEERHVSLVAARKDYLMALVKPMLFSFRNWSH